MKRAHLRYLDGSIRVIELGPDADGRPWPYHLKVVDPVLHPLVGAVLDVSTFFHVDRGTFDPDRDWQTYRETE